MADKQPDPRVGLCSLCRHARIVRSGKGSAFYLCTLAAADPRFRKYPPLPVVRCIGFRETAGDEPDMPAARADTAPMEQRLLYDDFRASVLTLGGGGLGQVWGATSRDEAVATVRRAAELGINFLDVAPRYGNGEAERVVGLAFEGSLPAGMRVETKCGLGSPPAEEVYERLSRSFDESLELMRLPRVDVLMLHGMISFDAPTGATTRTNRELFRTAVVPAFQRLIEEGRIGAWGISGIGEPDALIATLEDSPRPAVVQCITNPLHSAGGLKRFEGDLRAGDVIAAAGRAGVGVLGIRAVQAGALVDVPDRELQGADAADFERAAPFRDLARELGTSAAALAHRYALSMPGVASVVLGVKNRKELEECVAAAEAGPLPAEVLQRIDGLFSAN